MRSGSGRPLRAALVLSFVLGGCFGPPSTIERTVGGERRVGAFVSPHSYEHFLRAELARAAGDDAAARDEYELARAGAADDPLLCARLADTLDRLGDPDGADRALADGLALDPSAEVVHLAAGAIAERRGDTLAALAAYERAHDGAPESPAPVLAIARIAEATGARARAGELLAELASHPGAPRAAVLARLAETEDAPELEALAEALGATEPPIFAVAARRALALGHAPLASRLLGRLGARSEDRTLRIEVAIATHDLVLLREALATPPALDDDATLTADAHAYLALGDPTGAEARARAVLARGPHPAASLALGLALEARGELGEAATVLGAIPAGTSVTDDAHAALARVLEASGLGGVAREIRR